MSIEKDLDSLRNHGFASARAFTQDDRLTAAERVVIEAAVLHSSCRRRVYAFTDDSALSGESVRDLKVAGDQLDAAVDALIAAREGR